MCLPCMMYMKTENTCKFIIYLYFFVKKNPRSLIFKHRKNEVFLVHSDFCHVHFSCIFSSLCVMAKKSIFTLIFQRNFIIENCEIYWKCVICHLSICFLELHFLVVTGKNIKEKVNILKMVFEFSKSLEC